MESIHAHEALELLLEGGTSHTRKSFEAALAERFGPRVRFHACAADGMTIRELIAFLEARQKFLVVDGHLVPNRGNICGSAGEPAD